MTRAQHPQALVRFIDVQKSYDGETLIVKQLNLDVYRGEFLTLLGPSGSGKTTSLMMLAGFETATQGDIFVAEKKVNNIPPHKRGMGMVFQNYALFPHMTVAENLAFPLQVRKLPAAEIQHRVQQALEMVRLEKFATRRPAQLSGGQQQRIALARALIFKPEIVLMDEPLGALDKQLREHMQVEIKQLHQTLGITMVYVTHDQSEALTMSDRIAVFNDGVIQQLDSPSDLYERPNNAFVAQFIGENNRINGRLLSTEDKYCLIGVGDHQIKALAVNVGAVGEAISLSLRPERVEIEVMPGQYPNVFTAIVEEIIYLGDHLRLRLHVCGDHNFIVKVQNNHLGMSPVVGQQLSVGWHADDCRALDPIH